MIRIYLLIFLITSSLGFGLTFKDGKQVGDEKLLNVEKKNFNDKTKNPIAGFQIENDVININFPPHSPSIVRDKYWYGWFWAAQDFNQDGYLDYLYTGTMNPNNINHTGQTTGGACGGDRCEGEMPGPTLFLGSKDGKYILNSELFIDKREIPGQSLSRQNLIADFNGDKILDLFIADHAVGTHKGIRDSYFLSQNDGTWLESSNTHLSNPNYTIFDHGGAVGDIDNDGDIDIVLTELKNQLSCWINNGKGKMKLRVCGDVNAFGIELGDIDGDGYLDIVHAGHEGEGSTDTGIVLNDGDGFFKKRIKLPMIANWTTVPEVALWDLDMDGDLDIVLSRSGYLYVGTAVQILENKSNGKFNSQVFKLLEAPSTYKPKHEGNEWNAYIQNFLFGDFDNDNDQDILLVTHRDKHKHLGASILSNIGNMEFIHIPYGEKGNPINLIDDRNFIRKNSSSINKILNDVYPLNKLEVSKFKPMFEPVYFGSLGIDLTGAKLLSFEEDYFIYEGLFNYKDTNFSITLCAQYWDEHKFIGNRVGFNFTSGFGDIRKLKKYGTNYCGNMPGFAGHWGPEREMIKTETNLFPFLIEIENNWPEIFKNFSILNDSQIEIIENWN